MTIISHENPLAAWSLFLFQRQELLNNHLARVPITPNHQGTHEMGDEVLSIVGAQGMDTSGYQMSDLDDVKFYREKDQLDVDVLFRLGIDTPLSPTVFDDLNKGGSSENPILPDEKDDEENYPPTRPVSERPTQPPAMLRRRPVGTRTKNVTDYVYTNLFQ